MPYIYRIYVPLNAGERMFAAWRAGDLVAKQDQNSQGADLGLLGLLNVPSHLQQRLEVEMHRVLAPENCLAAPEDAFRIL